MTLARPPWRWACSGDWTWRQSTRRPTKWQVTSALAQERLRRCRIPCGSLLSNAGRIRRLRSLCRAAPRGPGFHEKTVRGKINASHIAAMIPQGFLTGCPDILTPGALSYFWAGPPGNRPRPGAGDRATSPPANGIVTAAKSIKHPSPPRNSPA